MYAHIVAIVRVHSEECASYVHVAEGVYDYGYVHMCLSSLCMYAD